MNSVNTSIESWYKQFWPWFIIALPASVVVAGFTTLYIALENNDYRVDDDYYKDGFHLQRNDVADKMARDIGVRASLQWLPEDETIAVRLGFDVELQAASSIRLKVSHPNNAALDFETDASSEDGIHYHANIAASDAGSFSVPRNITLEAGQFDDTGEAVVWRLRGRCDLSQPGKGAGVNSASSSCELVPKVPGAP